MKDRQDSINAKRWWECPNCGHKEKRHHATRKRPFCDPCDWQFACLIEMRPKGAGTESFIEGETA